MPEQWRVQSDETSTVTNVRWWKQLNDPILDELIAEALSSNYDLRIATARIAQYQAQLGIVSSQLYPQIYAQGTAARTRASQTLAPDFALDQIDKGDKGAASYSYGGNGAALPLPNLGQLFPIFSNDYRTVITAAYEVDLWGKIRSATKASYAELLGQVDARRTVILTVVSSVASSYILLRQYDRQLLVSRQTLRSRQESYDLANIRFQEGLTSELEVTQALAELDQAALQVIEFETRIPQEENLLSILIGHPPHAIERGRPVDGWTLPLEVPAGLPAEILMQRPDILQAEEQLKAANFRIGEARALYFPDFTLTGFYGCESAELHRLFTDPSRTWQWMANVLQPIFTGWRISSTVDLTEAVKREAVNNYLQTILTALKEVNDALIAHKNSEKALAVATKLEKDLVLYLHLATLQYQNGLVDYLNVLDAERRLFDAQLNLAKNQADVFITLVDIYKTLGGGWVIDAEHLMQGGIE